MICTGTHKTTPDSRCMDMYADYLSFVGNEHMQTCSGRAWDYAEALEQAGLMPEHVTLDVGCASSYFALYIAKKVKLSYGIDDLMSYAYETYTIPWMATLRDFEEYQTGRFVLVVSNAARLPFPDGFFDRIFTFSALEHFENDDDIDFAREAARVLKPGGSFLGTVDYNPIDPYPLKDYPICRVYSHKTFYERIVLPSGLKLIGKDFEADRADPQDNYVEALFFHLTKE